MWHKVADDLAHHFTIVVTDLRGYGASSKPPGDSHHQTYSKRASAQDQVSVMSSLGFDRFFIAGHDRGGRVGHRMALDYPEKIAKLALLDIVPTWKVYEKMNILSLAQRYYHWLFLIQPNGIPEHLIGLDPAFYLKHKMDLRHKAGIKDDAITPEAFAEYLRCFSDPAMIHATCEDYRAGASIDLEHHFIDQANDHKIRCPVLILWGKHGVMEQHFDVLETWQEVAYDVRGHSLDCGHYLAEEAPEQTYRALRDFFLSVLSDAVGKKKKSSQ